MQKGQYFVTIEFQLYNMNYEWAKRKIWICKLPFKVADKNYLEINAAFETIKKNGWW